MSMIKIPNILKVYSVLIILVSICVLRILFYKTPPAKQKDFTTNIVITNPIYIKDSQKVIDTAAYKVVSYDLPYCLNKSCSKNLELGDIVKVEGDLYYTTIYANKITYLKDSALKPLYRIKDILIKTSNQMLTEPYSSLLNGMLFGTEPVVSDSYKDLLIRAGVIHVIVVSGYNISILFTIMAGLFSRYSIRVKYFLGLILVIGYSIVVGFEPPVLRALIMGILAGYGTSYGRVRNPLYIFISTLLLILIYSPSLLYSLSFQLTVCATLGILLLHNKFSILFNKFLYFKIMPNVLKNDLISSICAQLFVIPLIAYYFKKVSLVGFILNPLILWLIPLIMFIGFILIVYYLIGLNYLLPFTVILIKAPLLLFNDVVTFFATIPFGQVEITFSIKDLIVYYFLAFVFVLIVYKKVKGVNAQ
ncbi:hypothetical protein COV24_00330 [candidate division WWE3 bacterium CG10_big_fil_rev_8_21_14_0_10_32_10]|uniref:ComEC/Rec2-related protein domain-containing protein n=1 Tax=candidate division WWE3 bacterium CG10_big_fil_rev_8_21_14_0_10_32_10 TaxID=1975090 RepID=A0A2H0RDI8_UNCKA|nr:MAG: hypothetical protein COV24_00330 [candidate division WWE3 bacterium CG10_big_fil_rev_8_21_14_0_10_32_10]